MRALEVLRDAGVELPRLNVSVAGEEADLSWPTHCLIIEIDGRPWHQDVGAHKRKETAWRGAGWQVHRIDAGAIYEQPHRLLNITPPKGRKRPAHPG